MGDLVAEISDDLLEIIEEPEKRRAGTNGEI